VDEETDEAEAEPEAEAEARAEAEAEEGDEASPWPARAIVVGWGLVAVVVVLLVGVLIIGLTASARQGSVFARLGAAYVSLAGPSYGLGLLGAAAVACWTRTERLRLAALVTAMALCVVTLLSLPGDVSNLHHIHTAVNGPVRWQLLTFFGVTFIPAALAALVASWGTT
jgi:hypothetical protein